MLPPTINLHTVDPACDGRGPRRQRRPAGRLRVALSASYGLGGHNAVLAMTRLENGDGP